jgi:mRNA interferase RelE/StbE
LAYAVELSGTAMREYARLDGSTKPTVLNALRRLESQPRHRGVRRVVGAQHLYRARAGDYRIIFAIHEARVVVHVMRVAHRSKIYRGVEDLPSGWD